MWRVAVTSLEEGVQRDLFCPHCGEAWRFALGSYEGLMGGLPIRVSRPLSTSGKRCYACIGQVDSFTYCERWRREAVQDTALMTHWLFGREAAIPGMDAQVANDFLELRRLHDPDAYAFALLEYRDGDRAWEYWEWLLGVL